MRAAIQSLGTGPDVMYFELLAFRQAVLPKPEDVRIDLDRNAIGPELV